jgi:hypothetical protein
MSASASLGRMRRRLVGAWVRVIAAFLPPGAPRWQRDKSGAADVRLIPGAATSSRAQEKRRTGILVRRSFKYRSHERVIKMWNSMLRRMGHKPKPRPFSEFIAFKETLKAAKAAGLSVGDYIESKRKTGSRTPTEQTIDGMASLGVFDHPLERICELGAGSGRYLERTIAKSHPRHYEVYETSTEWRNWLVEQHGIVARRCDGRTLGETESGSIALVQAHKVLIGLPFLTNVSYFQEMIRVVQSGGWIVFDIMTEECFSPVHLKAWLDAKPWDWDWSPHMVAKNFAVKLFADHGISFVGSFYVPIFPAITECMVFRKISPEATAPTGKDKSGGAK